ncbi:MAG TPA: ABC transporter permease subunit [Candidatus Eubacterium avistercoris]|uniref:ABC transporter permease subunit n=1 Tax=Candidatus Eubacterium avistercoris TaxID=2838567 RepID=A0A9D2D3L8_9FIRM|nr:ABC transporter permease subunit [Candidatus Eubacterium avistercoris]
MKYATLKNSISAIIKKDFRSVAANKKFFASLMIVPLILVIILPAIFIFSIHFAPEDPDIQRAIQMLPSNLQSGNLEQSLLNMLLHYILPLFFLIIPIMTASITAASAFVGEKEKHTLETLLYCPLSLRQIFSAKVLAAFLLSMIVSLISFFAMILVLEIEVYLLLGALVLPGASWIIILLLISPSVSLIAVTMIVKSSAKAKSVEESQQTAVFLILPVIFLIAGQFTGLLLAGIWILTGIGILCALLAWLLLRVSMKQYTYERLLKSI